MSELDFIYKRKSIRDYKDAVIPKEDILKMLDAATHAPSPKHQQNWHFVVVQDKEIINTYISADENYEKVFDDETFSIYIKK